MRLWLRHLDSDTEMPLPGTEAVDGAPNFPFWSWDSRFIVFASGAKLKKVEITGTLPQTICDFPEGRELAGGSWNRSGVILAGIARDSREIGGVYQLPEGGSCTTTGLYRNTESEFYGFPSLLPDGQHFLYFREGKPELQGIYVGALGSPSRDSKRVAPSDSPAVFAPSVDSDSGYIVFRRDKTVQAQRFNVSQ
jgi:hypothetical protein